MEVSVHDVTNGTRPSKGQKNDKGEAEAWISQGERLTSLLSSSQYPLQQTFKESA